MKIRWKLTRDEKQSVHHEMMREKTWDERRGIAAEILSAALLRQGRRAPGETGVPPADGGEGRS